MCKYDNHLCTDCAKATTGECSWSKNLKPVEGWKAQKRTEHFISKGKKYEVERYRVLWCPLFDRDAFGGTKRSKKLPEKAKEYPIPFLEKLYHSRDYDMVMPFGEFVEKMKDAEFQRRVL